MCNCKVCNKEFEYGDENSPMLENDIWNSIVNYYNLEEYETKASRDFYANYKYNKRGKFIDKPKYHLFICSDCMEKALNRKLELKDLINESNGGAPFNDKFKKLKL